VTELVGDTGAVVALATGSTLHARDLLQTAVAEGITLAVPAAAYAAAWASSAPLGRMLLDGFLDLSARAGGRASLDLSQVVVSAQARGWPVITATPGPLFALAPDVAVEVLP
jgi:hypothetical protein